MPCERIQMLTNRICLVLLTLASPALAQDGARDAAAAQDAAKAFKTYADATFARHEQLDLTRPDVAAWLGHTFDLDALNALPPAQGSDLPWMLDWIGAANAVNKAIILYGTAQNSPPDLEAIGRNMREHEDQYAAATNFLIRFQAREAIAMQLFLAGLTPEQRTPIREEGFARARTGASEMLIGAIGSVILGSSKPANARLVAAALRDTRETWANFLLPEERTRMSNALSSVPNRVADETARNDLSAFLSAIQPAN
jgi:hypothetical protein